MDTRAVGLPETVAEVCALSSEAHHRGTLPGWPRATHTQMGTLSGEGVAGVPSLSVRGRDFLQPHHTRPFGASPSLRG